MTREGAALIAENEALIRSKGSAVRVLRQNLGMVNARNRATEDLIFDAKEEMSKLRMSELLNNDNRYI